MVVLAISLAFVLGGAWRRWWGGDPPPASWWPWRSASGDARLYRALQAVVGVAALVLLGRLAGDSWLLAAGRAGLVIGFLSLPIAISRAWAEWPWLWIERQWGTPRWGRWFTGWTTYVEASSGALVWAVAMVVR